jgi:Tol biopolymer transport system component
MGSRGHGAHSRGSASVRLSRLAIGAVTALLLTVASSPPSVSEAATATVTGFVAVTNGTGSLQIKQFALDGSRERALTAGPANHHFPSLSPDGRRLLYTGNETGDDEIYELDVARPSTPVAITRPPMIAASASWSPDSKFIVFSGLMPNQKAFQIYRANPDGSSAVQLTHSASTGNTQPVVSPDNRSIAYINGGPSTIAGPFGSTLDIQSSSIWVMTADGGNPRQLTPGPLDAYPAWLDGDTVLFARADGLEQGSSVLSVTLSGSVSSQSPAGHFLVEPRPLPGGERYGATLVTGTSTELVIVDRKAARFSFTRIELPFHDGSASSISWLMSPAAPSSGVATFQTAARAVALGALGAFGIVLIVFVVTAAVRIWRRRRSLDPTR